ncbi:NAD(P)/FAD-dependent oxidoreductase [Serpentinicella sp. ANB-PHB4]|uniref:NAD(P)/FAD-dependent oxidoreductase n=1 Tax=Serpentinicella sp. ANB-PHB4 TaxID=3074076 RepID=UPI00285C0599|nr:NAD(P)/FAD-dependent oxidoreductase [Serpentinicella sp. ANB-PHB4]MDR5658145.1 NAD(P)/FAD-dependent oxidoreductase [Serpentinicella sp. ANB-PHB4]
MINRRIVIIGAGPAGILASIIASKNNNQVILLEKNREIGKKLSITGGGRCNITNNCDIDTFIKNTVSNSRFLYSSFNTFDNQDLMNFLEGNGLNLKVEELGRVFPASNASSEVIDFFLELIQKERIDLRLNTQVKGIKADKEAVYSVILSDNSEIKADSIICTTGGMSYPNTGSTGDGYNIVEKLGHKIVDIKPALSPIEIDEEWAKSLMGLSLTNIAVTCKIKIKNKVKKSIHKGSIIFTHYGVSGPVILEISSKINRYILDDKYEITFFLDFLPDISDSQFELDFKHYTSQKEVTTSILQFLNRYMPKNLSRKLLDILKIDRSTSIQTISKNELSQLIDIMKRSKMTPIRLRGIKEAIVTSGGVSTKEIDPKTMESKLIKGLYFAGEIIDVDALSGGFNLQIAFSTGYVAGSNA